MADQPLPARDCSAVSSRGSIHLLDLPNEIVYLILGNLNYASEISALALTCRQLCPIANTILYTHFKNIYSPYALRCIVAHGNEESLQKLLSAGISYDRYSVLNAHPTPLAVAASCGQNNIIKLIVLHHGPSVINGKLSDGSRPLVLAVRHSHLETVKLLVQLGSTPRDKAKALIDASYVGNVEIVKFLVEQAGIPIQPVHQSGGNALMSAVKGGHMDTVQFLLASGADPNTIWNTSLFFRGVEDSVFTLLELLNDGLSLDMELPFSCKVLGEITSSIAMESGNEADWTILSKGLRNLDSKIANSTYEDRGYLLCFAAGIGDHDLITTLFAMGYSFPRMSCNPLRVAVHRGDCSILSALLDGLRSDTYLPVEGQIGSAIETAVNQLQYEALEMLLSHGYEDDRVCRAEFALHHAFYVHSGAMCLYLLHSNSLLENGLTSWEMVLRWAIRADNWNVAKAIIDKKGASLWHRWETPEFVGDLSIITSAASYGAFDCFNQMLRAGLQLDPTTSDSCTALQVAMRSHRPDLVTFFLDSGFDANFQANGIPLIVQLANTARSIAFSGTSYFDALRDTFRLLIDRGANINAQSEKGFTALAYICLLKQKSTMTQLLLAWGANPLLGIDRHASALEMAINHCNPECVQMFLDTISYRKLHVQNFRSLIPALGGEWEDGKVLDHEKKFGDKYFVVKAMETYYWRSIYPVSRE